MNRKDWQELIPHSLPKCPQTFDPAATVKQLSDQLGYSSVIDLGCGHGRLSEAFAPEKYLGLDIDEKVLEIAKQQFSNYRFEPVGEQPKFADIYVAYSLFSSLTDFQAHEALKKVRCKWLILGEQLKAEDKGPKLSRLYTRDLDDYIRLFRAHDFTLHKHVKKPYREKVSAKALENPGKQISFLVFRKCPRNPFI